MDNFLWINNGTIKTLWMGCIESVVKKVLGCFYVVSVQVLNELS
jgi:hypothetical protein